MAKGGEGYRLGIFRAGHMIEAKRNTYKRVYKSDGSYHHPRVDAGLLRKKVNFISRQLRLQDHRKYRKMVLGSSP